MNFNRSTIVQTLMRSLFVVKLEIIIDAGASLTRSIILIRINIFIFDRTPQPLNKNVVISPSAISASSYSRYECGTNEPSLETLKKLAALFDCTVDYLLEIDGTAADTDKVVDLNDFINNGKYTIFSRFPNKRDRKIINSFINSVFEYDEMA